MTGTTGLMADGSYQAQQNPADVTQRERQAVPDPASATGTVEVVIGSSLECASFQPNY